MTDIPEDVLDEVERALGKYVADERCVPCQRVGALHCSDPVNCDAFPTRSALARLRAERWK